MTIINRLEKALLDRNLYKKAAAQYIGVPPTTFQTWISRGTDLPAQYVVPLCNFLEVSPIWLLTGQEVVQEQVPDDMHRLSDDEWFLVKTFRELDRAGKIVVSNKAIEESRRSGAEQGKGEANENAG